MNVRNGGRAIAVMVVAASSVRRAGLENVVKSSSELRLAGSLQDLTRLEHYIRELQAAVVLLDLEAHLGSGEFLEAIDIPIVALIDEPESQWIAQALRSSVRAILPRDSEIDEIVSAIQAAAAGMVMMDAEAAQTLAGDIRPRLDDVDSLVEELTPREVEVLGMLAEGLRNREMAIRLGISEHTVKFHISSIFQKLGAATRTESVKLGLRRGLILI